jgi:23S rRNA (adenine2030-N6)-methyltransferase
MNYRHAYHAGNHTEVFKHAVVVLLLQHLLQKHQPFMVLDTHAGAGIYDLTTDAAEKTGEALDGIGRVMDKEVPTAAAYLDLIRRMNPADLRSYPGSPAIVRAFLRERDRLIACELREDDAGLLRANFRDDRRVSVHHRDGYEALPPFCLH